MRGPVGVTCPAIEPDNQQINRADDGRTVVLQRSNDITEGGQRNRGELSDQNHQVFSVCADGNVNSINGLSSHCCARTDRTDKPRRKCPGSIGLDIQQVGYAATCLGAWVPMQIELAH